MKTSMDLLQDSINDIDQLYGNLPMLLVGDFNARLGALSPIQEELVTNTNIYATREASDEEINTRGRTLDNAMTESSLIVINGRSFSDRPSKHTCLHINKSTIDFVWANVSALSIIYDLEILQIENPSDHFPLLLQLYYDEPPLTQATIENKNREMFQWTSTGEDEYRARMTWSDKVALINNDNLDEINNILITENKIAAEAAGMKKQLKGLHRLKRSQLWYDDECKQGKQELAKLFKSYKKAGFQGQAKELYVQAKKKQKALVKRKKQQVREQQLNNLANTNKPSDFWKTVSRFKSHPGTGKNPISIQAWENFYENNIPNREEDTTTYYGVLDPNLDCEFTLSELNRVLNKSKSNKATGPDGVKNEHLKNLPENWKLYILCLFNKTLEKETVPSDWFSAAISLIHKKGNDQDRPIALINHIAKLFTGLLNYRIEKWAEKAKIFPECQAGFRSGRGCLDNLYVLHSVIQFRLR
ncbi:GSCOCG00011986001-RA-CDS [Cotesia congregata]|nr:GSCOCG00011986001-RA-CDS [Cotesia congregata]